MHSSTSSSDDRVRIRLDRSTIVTLGIVVSMLALAEGITLKWFDRISKVQRLELLQRRTLLDVRDAPGSARAHVAIVGNSLLRDGLDVGVLSERLEPQFIPEPYIVLATVYNDWYFGLKRLFAQGMRPAYVVLSLSPYQFAATYTRGDYSARYLFDGSDLLTVARETHMDPTAASGFLLSHFSEYYSTRGITRGFILSQLLPSVRRLLSELASGREPEVAAPDLRQRAVERLAALDALCRGYGSQFVLVIPPTYQRGADIIDEVGKTEHVRVLVPVGSDTFDASYYQSDGFHLNEKGARAFSAKLGAELASNLSIRRDERRAMAR